MNEETPGPNFRHEGGLLLCGWCGFVILVSGPRQCCERGKAWDANSTYRRFTNDAGVKPT